jgi:ABC-2 type transport system permease protein
LTFELARYPAYVVPTLAFPAAFFLIFSSTQRGTAATVEMATFAGFAAIGVAFFQFGVGIAVERASPWETYLRTLPIGAGARLSARVLSAAVFACAASATLVAIALASTDATLAPERWAELAITLLLGVAPFALLGIALGYWAPARGALPIANLLYLALSYAGALWIRPHELPSAVASVSPYLPTRALADALSGTVLGHPFGLRAWASLAGFTALFAALAVWGYLRDEGRRFR